MHYIDNCALADPLLARLPAKENPNWRIGHFVRQLPTDYKESIEQGENLLKDPRTKSYWDSIRSITRGPLWDKERVFEIFKMNLGLIQKPDMSMYRQAIIQIVRASSLKPITQEGTAWNEPNNMVFYHAIEIVLEQPTEINLIDVALDHNDEYEIWALSDQDWVLLATIHPTHNPGMARHKIKTESTVRQVEKFKILARTGDGMYSVGHFLVNEP